MNQRLLGFPTPVTMSEEDAKEDKEILQGSSDDMSWLTTIFQITSNDQVDKK